MRKLSFLVGMIALGSLAPLQAQLFSPNETGVAMGQWHTIVRNVDATTKFWTLLGGTPMKVDGTPAIKFAGVLILLTQGNPSNGTEGTVVNHIGLGVPDIEKAFAKLKAEGIEVQVHPSALNGLPVGVTWSPDKLMVEIETIQTLSTPCEIVSCIPYLAKWPAAPIASNHIHFYVPTSQREQMQAWYTKVFGSTPGVSGENLTGDLPGARVIRWSPKVPPGENPLATKGTALDYLGFEIKNLEAFCKKLEAQGVKLDQPYSKTRHKSFASAELVDPWGVSIELTEGLNRF